MVHRRRKQSKKPPRKRSGMTNTTPLSPHSIDRFSRIMQAALHGGKVDIGVTPPGTIRLLTHVFGDPGIPTDWFHATLLSHDRTFMEWRTLIDEYKGFPLSNGDSVSAPPFHPFLHRSHAGEYMEKLFLKNMTLRWLARKFVVRLRRRIMDRRHVGDTDLYTTLPIPENARVSVYDWKSRSKYSFHTHTAVQIVEKGLQYSCYGIAHPNEPKNPYTNIVWNLGQKLEIISQITTNLMRAHRVLPSLLYSYSTHRYDIQKFFNSNRMQLQVGAAESFFRNHHDPDVISISDEILDGLYNEVYFVHKPTWKKIKREILLRNLPTEHQRRWDRLILASWIWDNHRILYDVIRIFDEIDNEFRELYTASVTWWMTQPRTLLRRTSNE